MNLGRLLLAASVVASTLFASDFVDYKALSKQLIANEKKNGNFATTQEVKAALADKEWAVVDVRTEDEWAAGFIKGTQRIGREAPEKALEGIVLDDNGKFVKDKIIVVCNSASRASIEADTFRKMGFKTVKIYPLYTWIDECNPITTKYSSHEDKEGTNKKFGDYYKNKDLKEIYSDLITDKGLVSDEASRETLKKFFSILRMDININKSFPFCNSEIIISKDIPKNILFKGVPGTGKSYIIDNIIEYELLLKNKPENICRINIHSASSNADLMQGIAISTENNQVSYKEKQGLVFNTTNDIIEAINQNRLPYRLMITTHPQRWTDQPFAWLMELVMQSTKNTIKKWLIMLRG